jgi:RimJ/RimL family protein N-acetyltransferase
MKENIELSCKKFPGIVLKSACYKDIENLRVWKNENKESFFFKGIISPSDQIKWYSGYLERSDDFMFIVNVLNRPIGCMGFRYEDNVVDIYNVILGDPKMSRKGYMEKAFHIMSIYAEKRYNCKQSAKVLRNNPAINWYERCNFRKVGFFDEYYVVELNKDLFRPIKDLIVISKNTSRGEGNG